MDCDPSIDENEQNAVGGMADPPFPLQSFKTIITAMEDSKVLKPPLLKGLYYLLTQFSLDKSLHCSKSGDINYCDLGSHQMNIRVTFSEICHLANFLFDELRRRFELLYSDLCNVSENKEVEQVSSNSDIWGHPEHFILLLRCCMVLLHLLEFDQRLLFEKCQIMLEMLGILCSQDLIFHVSRHLGENEKNAIKYELSVSHECTYASRDGITSVIKGFDASFHFVEQHHPCLLLCSILEAFADEFLVHRSPRQYLMMIDSSSCAAKRVFMCDHSHGDGDYLWEVISSHFLLSFSAERIVDNFINRLIWIHGKDFRTPELSLAVSMALLGSPVMLSAPHLFQAHLILLVSEVIGIGMVFEDARLDPSHMSCYLSAFERSVILYTRLISSMHAIGCNVELVYADKSYKSEKGFLPSLEYYIQPRTKDKINHLISKFDQNSRHSKISVLSSREKSDMMTASIAFLRQNKCFLDKLYGDDILSVLNCILLTILSDGSQGYVLHKNWDVNQQEIFLLASLLKLMSISMQQIIWCMRQSGNSGCQRTLKDCPTCRDYVFLVDVIRCFRKCSVTQPIQRHLFGLMGAYPGRHEESKQMFIHFSGLLLLSFYSRLEVLWKSCLFMMMALTNLFIFEEGNLDALSPLLNYGKESSPSGPSSDEFPKALINHNSSLVVASNIRKTQMLYLWTDTHENNTGRDYGEAESSGKIRPPKDIMGYQVGIEEDICRGDTFLKCMQKGHKKPDDFDELADFIACKRGKDYTGWLKNRRKYRKWKQEKLAILRWKRKERAWKFL